MTATMFEMASVNQVRGVLLEEAILMLLRASGYRTITTAPRARFNAIRIKNALGCEAAALGMRAVERFGPSDHHFILAAVSPADCPSRIGIGWFCGVVVVMECHFHSAAFFH